MEKEMNAQNSKPNPVFVNTRKAILDRLGDVGVHTRKHHFLLVHEGGHGAWSWYKTADLLQKSGHTATAFDLAGSGLHPTPPSNVSTFEEYVQPLLQILESIQDSLKVVLVGHGLGGMAVAYASEKFASKIAVAVYIAALMLPGGLQSLKDEITALNAANEDEGDIEPFWEQEATLDSLSRDELKEILYNTSPSEDIQLASCLLRPVPAAAKEAKVETSDEGYGSVGRVFIKASEDRAFPLRAQETMIRKNPPCRVLSLKCDHTPIFSAAQELHHMLMGIAETYDR